MLIVLAARHDMSLRNLSETEQLIIYTLDNTAAAADLNRNPMGQFLCLFDLSGAAVPASAWRLRCATIALSRSLLAACVDC